MYVSDDFEGPSRVLPPDYQYGETVIEAGVETHTLSYVIRKRREPLIVLIPGSFNDFRDWLEVASRFHEDLSVVIVALPGHAGTSRPWPTGTIEGYAKVIIELLHHENFNKIYLGGHSIGGMIAIEACKLIPHNLEGVISCEGWTNYRVEHDAFRDLKVNTLKSSHRERLQRQKDEVSAHWTQEQKDQFATIWTRWDGYEILCNTSVPVLELWGDRGLDPRPTLELMRIPQHRNIEVVWIGNGSHYLTLQYPDTVAAKICAFIKKNSKGTAQS